MSWNTPDRSFFSIPAVPSEQQKPVERLVERESDELVYALYGLTPEEKSPRAIRRQMNPRQSVKING